MFAAKKLPELGFRVVLREESLDRVFEGKVERLGGEIANDVHRVATPEG